MFCHLTVIDFAIVKRVDLEFDSGMTVLTGETGAGKSVLIDALSLALGERANATGIRPGAERTDVSAVFDISVLEEVRAWLHQHELEDTQDECILRRTVSQDGRSRAYINGRPVAVNTLRELGDRLVDIHGQHLHQSLLRGDTQRQLLDDFCEHPTLIQAVRHHFEKWAGATRELESLSGPSGDREARLDLLRYQANELNTLGLQDGEFESLSEEQRRLAHINELITLGANTLQRLDGETFSGVVLNLQECLRDLGDMCRHEPNLESVHSLLQEATIQVNEAVSDLRAQVERLEPDPQRLQSVDQRLSTSLDLARKHHTQPQALAQVLPQLEEAIAKLADSACSIEELTHVVSDEREHYREAATALSDSRARAATLLSQHVNLHLSQIGMSGSQFYVSVIAREHEDPKPNGADKIEFKVSTNPGQPPLALSRIASGGELSRISLALQVVTVEGTRVPTVIFDEVDAGIGGAVAQVVGEQMRALGERRQVLCVTHLAQVASQAHHHIQVEKQADSNSVDTSFEKLDVNARVEEIARMIGGVDITTHTLTNAKEMLEQANN